MSAIGAGIAPEMLKLCHLREWGVCTLYFTETVTNPDSGFYYKNRTIRGPATNAYYRWMHRVRTNMETA